MVKARPSMVKDLPIDWNGDLFQIVIDRSTPWDPWLTMVELLKAFAHYKDCTIAIPMCFNPYSDTSDFYWLLSISSFQSYLLTCLALSRGPGPKLYCSHFCLCIPTQMVLTPFWAPYPFSWDQLYCLFQFTFNSNRLMV